MARIEQDTIQRQIRQLGDMVAAIVARAKTTDDYASGLEAIRDIASTGLGPNRALLDRLDAKAAVQLLRDADRARVYAQICAAEAELMERTGRADEAAARRARAAAIEEAIG